MVTRAKIFKIQEEEDDLSDSETDDINNCDSVNLNPCSTKKDNVSTSCSNDKETVLEANFVPPDESIISLSLSELCHIRSELAKAELEVTCIISPGLVMNILLGSFS